MPYGSILEKHIEKAMMPYDAICIDIGNCKMMVPSPVMILLKSPTNDLGVQSWSQPSQNPSFHRHTEWPAAQGQHNVDVILAVRIRKDRLEV